MKCSQPDLKIGDFTRSEESNPEAWTAHEHVADSVNKEAQHLVRMAESVALAKQALGAVEETMSTAAQQELAQDLGYVSVRLMLEQTEVVALPNGSFMHLTTDADGYWVAWNDKPFYDIQRFASRQQALAALQDTWTHAGELAHT